MAQRPDLTPKDVALRWLAGASLLALADEFGTSVGTIKRRLKRAREAFPELPWSKRETRRGAGPTVDYIDMKDGDPRAHVVPKGSVVLERRRRRI
jgi:hypothetical protein